MAFPQQLKDYLDELGCTPVELARACSISPSTVSRYLSGQREPKPHSAGFQQLCLGIVALSGGRYSIDEVRLALSGDDSENDIDPEQFTTSFRLLIEKLGIGGNRLARALGFDPSYISRISSGQRMPSNQRAFVAGTARYVARSCSDARSISALSSLLDVPEDELASYGQRYAAVSAFLGMPLADDIPQERGQDASLPGFLEHLDSFNLNDFLVDVKFDEIKVPTMPFSIPTSRTYTGIEQMKQAEIDFLRSAVLSRSTEDVIMFSDMPIEEMGADEQFAKNVMMGIALLVRKGIHLHNIHNIHRPLNELFMGLEAWIPLYMTGQLSSYYLPEPTNQVFLHFIRSAGTVAAAGEAIAGDQGSGRYLVSKRSDDVAYYRTRATQLLGCALPLISVYRDGDDGALSQRLALLHAEAGDKTVEVGEGVFRNMTITVLPGTYALITKEGAPRVRLLTEFPALVDALLEFEPVLFNQKK